jgi:hypothetical protein
VLACTSVSSLLPISNECAGHCSGKSNLISAYCGGGGGLSLRGSESSRGCGALLGKRLGSGVALALRSCVESVRLRLCGGARRPRLLA